MSFTNFSITKDCKDKQRKEYLLLLANYFISFNENKLLLFRVTQIAALSESNFRIT